jgi:hypothetical protein
VGSLLEAAFASERNLSSLSEAGQLRRAAEHVASLAHETGAMGLLPASPAGELIVGAALALSPDLRAHLPGQNTDTMSGHHVLIVDLNLASGTGMAQAAQRARGAGAAWVSGAALHALPHAVGAAECGLDSLKILEE